MIRILAVALLLTLPVTAARAQSAAGVEISGQVQRPATFSIEGLAARLMVPGDRKAGRDVRDLVAIEVR